MFIQPGQPLWSELESIAGAHELRLYDVEKVAGGSQGGLRVFIDKVKLESADSESIATEEDSQAGVTSGDCSKLCKRLMVYFQVEGVELGVGSEPRIEVSSPGVNRHLRLLEHFASAIGERVRILLLESDATEQQLDAVLIGELKAVDGDTLKVLNEATGNEQLIQHSWIRKARVEYKFS